jgi:hypothetical protein
MKRIDITGKNYGRLTVLKFSHVTKGNAFWLCKCECGNIKNMRYAGLSSGKAKSCGCLKKELSIMRLTTHGLTNSPEYSIHWNMISRCANEKNKAYQNYGGRGISVCKEWLESFECFYADMGARPTAGHSLDRIDVNGNYEPSNCRWATKSEQMSNMRSNRFISIDGETKILSEWSKISGVLPDTIAYRLDKNWDTRKAVFQPVRGKPA